jgi:hypothetical protein
MNKYASRANRQPTHVHAQEQFDQTGFPAVSDPTQEHDCPAEAPVVGDIESNVATSASARESGPVARAPARPGVAVSESR